MGQAFLEVTYRDGQPFAAYYYLAGRAGRRCHRSKRAESGLVVDFASDGEPIGIEITSPQHASAAALNRVLKSLGLPPLKRMELAPLRAAS